jgi:Tol biopolymer transport system component
VPGDTNKAQDVFVYDRQTRKAERVSVSSAGKQGNGPSGIGAISADGKVVAFVSDASNLAPHDTNNFVDTFVRVR